MVGSRMQLRANISSMPTRGEGTNTAGSGANSIPLGITEAFTSREEAKKQRELEEARKSGLIPAEKDEDVAVSNKPSLKHQRVPGGYGPGEQATAGTESSFDKWHKRGVIKDGATKVKFPKGACANCGALTHSAKFCTERPRKIGAKWTGKDLEPDELLPNSEHLDLDFDGKRDRYGGYDVSEYAEVIREYEIVDQQRKRRKAQQLLENDVVAQQGKSNARQRSDSDPPENPDADDDVKESGGEAIFSVKDDRTRTTSMNLRIREDTAKYLHNLDVNSAFYDPKSRSMREDPLKGLADSELARGKIFRGDNATRNTADAAKVTTMEIFAWEAYKHQVNVHAQAQPTQLELLHRLHLEKKQKLAEDRREALAQKYKTAGDLVSANQSVPSVSTGAPVAQDVYIEYKPIDGGKVQAVVKTAPVIPKSCYMEDQFFGFHTAIFGSFYDKILERWGYACCKQTDRNDPICNANDTTVAESNT